ncbi:MAG: septum formation initiator family protein [Lutibacter sp.]|uniref:FtsB family cell division protein n=1 Tax=Lutibacter sp. TaxID=1925666 RepID=UPI00299EB5B7|nr:septum formation initiator family protein [Lutibacter sp.]MDX1828990.1 septum formation initiator family protein [Lutibacter sp.]
MTFKQLKNKPLIKFITNIYVIILVIFMIWMFFFDENSILIHYEFNKEINKLKNEKNYYKTEIAKDKSIIDSLKNPKQLEKFAREKYHMKKENEDIYIIKYDTIKNK